MNANTGHNKFRMGRLDHAHIRVLDRKVAAQWYADHLGFEPVKKYKFWEKGFEGGPLQLSADGGKSMIALFVATTDHPMTPQTKGIAFNTDIENFMNFGTSPLTELTVH
ncbi:MAG: VOC family protein [Candidatus Thiodiazotropha sp.]|jgi:catechol 2,3-dioxygenase-like lactoylglutathione lyase family enzyme